jgi:N6-L-threonylcarbamoyladenine synthase
MLILGLESSCDETAAAVVERGRLVRSSVVASQNEIHRAYAGVVPELASRAHVERILGVTRDALANADVRLDQIDAIAVGHRPGLIGCVLVAVSAAKALSWSLGKPIVGVDHVHAHLYSGVLEEVGGPPALPADDVFPALGLVVSGGHTAMYELTAWTQMRRLGSTIDDAMGEAYDKAATILGLGFPGGPALDRLARTPGARADAEVFPISRIAPESLDFSFSGLKTALLYAVKGVPEHHSVTRARATGSRTVKPPPPAPLPLTETRRADLAASFQHAAVAAIMLKLGRAADAMSASGVKPRTLLTGGGVTANSHLRMELQRFAEQRGFRLALPAMKFCVDNAAMLAGLGHELLAAGRASDLNLEAMPATAI